MIAIIGALVALLLPAIQAARESARRAQCVNNLRQQGLAVLNFESAKGALPIGSIVADDVPTFQAFGADGVFANAFTQLLPFMEQRALAERYDHSQPWYRQDASIASAVIPNLQCPSNATHPNPMVDPFFEFGASTINSPLGSVLGRTDYVFSKGASDAFCETPRQIADAERGLFDYNLRTRTSDVLDGMSRTLAIGEGAGGDHWLLCQNPGCTTPDMPDPIPKFSGQPYTARQYWIGAGNVAGVLNVFKWASAGHFASTVDRLNKRPVTQFLFDDKDNVRNCQGSLTNRTNSHRVPNFRSDHPGGGNFAFADGGVRFVEEGVVLEAYRAMSTVAGEETASGL